MNSDVTDAPNMPDIIEHYSHVFESLNEQDLTQQLNSIMHPNIRFKDPFNSAVGIQSIEQIFEHMYQTVDKPKFRILNHSFSGRQVYFQWMFTYYQKGKLDAFVGMSQVMFDEAGKATLHIDYWDPVENLYQKIPILGNFFKFLTRKLSASN